MILLSWKAKWLEINFLISESWAERGLLHRTSLSFLYLLLYIQLCASTNTLGRFINWDLDSSSVYDAHRESCTEYGSGKIIENYNQFLHVEIEKFWRDNTPVMTDFYLNFFKETMIQNYQADSFYDFFLENVYPDILRNNAKDSVSCHTKWWR